MINFKNENDCLTIYLNGHIDSNNSEAIEQEIRKIINDNTFKNLILDGEELKYISSSGLRIILRLKKEYDDLKIINVSSEVYEIFDITGFSEMMTIEKAYRKVSIDNCEVIGQGANGVVYRINSDTIVKLYRNPDSLPEIRRERELARAALILGIPTAIPYDVVKVNESYGSVFELLNAKSFAKIIISEPDRFDEIAKLSVDLLKKIHTTKANTDIMPNMKKTVIEWFDFLKDYLSQDVFNKLKKLVNEVPEDEHMIHGDYHIKNVLLQDGEVLLIDMDTICYGYPIFEFASIYNAYQGFSDIDHKNIESFLGITYEQGARFWNKTLELYFTDKNEEEREKIADKAKLIGFVRILRRTIRRYGYKENDPAIEYYRQRIIELADKVDTLLI